MPHVYIFCYYHSCTWVLSSITIFLPPEEYLLDFFKTGSQFICLKITLNIECFLLIIGFCSDRIFFQNLMTSFYTFSHDFYWKFNCYFTFSHLNVIWQFSLADTQIVVLAFCAFIGYQCQELWRTAFSYSKADTVILPQFCGCWQKTGSF